MPRAHGGPRGDAVFHARGTPAGEVLRAYSVKSFSRSDFVTSVKKTELSPAARSCREPSTWRVPCESTSAEAM